jgi:4-hydroxybenzoate polyprenyltransferase
MAEVGKTGNRVADAAHGNWVDRFAPEITQPYLRLMRADRPIGAWLLMWPGLWSVTLAADYRGDTFPSFWLIALFVLGAFVMRGAGCVYNDIIDRDFDGKVARTRSRPIPSGQVGVRQALAFMAGLLAIGFLILIQFNIFAIFVGAASLITILIYPFMKRVTSWPQLFLGFAFTWGALLGWAAVMGRLDYAAFALYGSGILWTIGYDTIYAHQDKEDDALIGVKSTALRLSATTPYWLVGFFSGTIVLMALAGWLAGAGLLYYTGLAGGALHLAWQIARLDIDDPDRCLMLFRSNRDFGWIIFAGILADTIFTSLN